MVGVVGIIGVVCRNRHLERPVPDLDGVGTARHLDDRSIGEVPRKTFGLNGRRRHDDLEVGSARQQLTKVSEQEVDVEAALVRLVEDQRVVTQQPPVPLDLGEQNAIGHQLDQRAVAGLIGEAHGVADGVAERGAELVGDALRNGARRQPPGLRVSDGPADAAAEVQADLRQLSGLARARRARDDHHLVLVDGLGQLVAVLTDGQVGVGDRRDGGLSGDDECFGGGDLFGDLGGVPTAQVPQAAAQPVGITDGQCVEAGAELGD